MTTVRVVDQVGLGDHVFWSYDDTAAALDAVGRFLATGLRLGHKALCFLDALAPDAVLADLSARGVPADAARAEGRLRLLPAGGSYRPGRRFDRPGMIAVLAAESARAHREGYPGLRLVGDMAWAARAGTSVVELHRYETEVNALFPDGTVAGLCLYDRRLFPADQIRAIAAAHPGSAGPDTGGSWRPLLRAYRTRDPAGLRLVGEIDRSNGDAFTAMLSGMSGWAVPGGPAVLDVSGLSFADVGAAHDLLRAGETQTGGLRLVGCRPAVRRLLDLVGQGAHLQPVGRPA
ncbi:MEDS domain-containing protein [Micromonospora sp. WMMD812]|uniref:MEDS domain-containing protein n=1 Tax=Micromonospora sp. WMMD812 TaxID=3015152 RepID=UPI00248C77DF|nr:MEDS domain-containing protein [Micromonospora sp. WMMD812]WBB68654.1 MEDS domain-containing protein [Micromonospora sp. WMMD812]